MIDKIFFDAIQNHKTIHLCGIGGVSMRALAHLLINMGARVQGSDRDNSPVLEDLRKLGAIVFLGHDAENITNAAVIIRTAAVPDSNPEIAAARANNLLILERAQAWGLLMRGYDHAICIAGTHGKTSTTSMLSAVLIDAGLDPTIMVGGNLPLIGGSLRIGGKNLFLAEACEYKNSFLSFLPTVAIILNIDRDHLDFFNSTDDIIASFSQFASLVPGANGAVIANMDDGNVKIAARNCARRVIGFGVDSALEVHPKNLVCAEGFYSFDIVCGGEFYCHASLRVPGEHNMKNALAAAAAAWFVGVPGDAFSAGIDSYTGVGRRFEKLGEYNGAQLYDDYAHHPDEIIASLQTARSMGFKRIICIFQPHTYSRTIMLFDEFAKALELADIAVLSEIFAAREANTHNISSKSLAEKIPHSVYVSTLEKAAEYIRQNAQEGDIIFTMGAGDIFKVHEML